MSFPSANGLHTPTRKSIFGAPQSSPEGNERAPVEASLSGITNLVPPRARDLSELATAGQAVLKATREDLDRDGLQDTPMRFAKAMDTLLSGYQRTTKEVVGAGIFPAEGKGLVSVRNVEFYSLCEHHLLPFWGTMTVAYYPNEKILGLSKIPRLIDHFARRVQVQERLTEQVADSLVELVQPRFVAVKAKACHLCMMMRGVEKQGSDTVTETFRELSPLSPLEQQRIFESLTLGE